MTIGSLSERGRIGRHPAVTPQCLVVLSGAVEVAGADGVLTFLPPSHMAVWERGEQHEAVALTDAVLLVLEGGDLQVG